MRKVIFLICLLFISYLPLFAQDDGNPSNWCRNGHFPKYGNFGVAFVKPKKGKRAAIYKDEDNCPKGKSCQSKAYLVSGDQLITSKKYGEFTCVWYQPRNGSETVGWVLTENLDFPLFATHVYSPWPGDWEYAGNTLSFSTTVKEDSFKVKGNAYWRGLGDNIHIGEIDAEGVVTKESKMFLGQDTCEINMEMLIGTYLIVSDNLECGGANVTFTGVYTKLTKASVKPKRP